MPNPSPSAADDPTRGDSSADAVRPGPKKPRPAEPPDLRFLGPPLGPGELGRLGGYRVLEVLGAGGMGLVLRGEDPRLRRPVAVKVMRPGVAADPVAADRFLREARAAAAVRSDHIVTIYQVGQDRGVPFLAMELLRGEPLDARADRLGRLPPFEVMRVGHQTALGLAAAHEAGLVHRDVKPANVWLEAPAGRVKLLDFGLARAAREDLTLTGTGAVLGTPRYMSPEQANGKAVDARSDLFSLGVVLYRLSTGVLPFDGDTALAVMAALVFADPPPPRSRVPEIPPELDALIVRLLAKDPADRPGTAREVAEVLAPAVNTVTVVQVVAGPPSGPAYDPTFAFDPEPIAPVRRDPKPEHRPAPDRDRSSRRGTWLAAVAAVAFAGLAVGVTVRILTRPAPPVDTSGPTEPTAKGGGKKVTRPEPWRPPAGFDRLAPAEQFEAVVRGLGEVNPGWSREGRAHPEEKSVWVSGAGLSDLAPLAALSWLEHLEVRTDPAARHTSPTDLAGLRGANLRSLAVASSRVRDLSPLRGMGLRSLHLEGTDVFDLSPLAGMPLQHLRLDRTGVRDLSPLAAAPLVTFDAPTLRPTSFAPVDRPGLQVFRAGPADPDEFRKALPNAHPRIEFVRERPAREFWTDGGTFEPERPKPADEWLARAAELKGDELLREVVEELRRRNPGWRPGEEYRGRRLDPAGNLVRIEFFTAGLRDATPLRALTTLTSLRLTRPPTGLGPLLTDLEPLRGLRLEEFESYGHWFTDLAPLRDMPLRRLYLSEYKPWYKVAWGRPAQETIKHDWTVEFPPDPK